MSRSRSAFRSTSLGLALGLALASALHAQDPAAGGEAPMSAIDWLSRTLRTEPAPPHAADVATEAGTDTVTTERLDAPNREVVGLLPPAVSGLPWDFWGPGKATAIGTLIRRMPADGPPTLRALLHTVLLSELGAPQGESGAPVLQARIDKLLDLGALDQAQSLMERAGFDDAEVFRRWFDVSLLTDHADIACAALAAKPDLAPTMMARVFCLARTGDWNAAALTLETGAALGFLTEAEADLLAWFLDPALFEGAAEPAMAQPVTALDYTLREALGMARPALLPAAFLVPDLSPRAGWRSQLLAAERLAVTGAIEPARLFGLYTEGKPAASGGVWERASAVQRLDIALVAGNPDVAWAAAQAAWHRLHEVGLESALTAHYADRLLRLNVPVSHQPFAMRMLLLSPAYESVPRMFEPATPKDRFHLLIAAGLPGDPGPDATPVESAVSAAFAAPLGEGPLRDMVEEGRLGEAVLTVIGALREGGLSDPGDIESGLKLLRRLGLEDEARRTALEILLLETRG